MERLGAAFELGEQLTALGRPLAVGETAPDFALDHFDPGAQEMRVVRLADSAGQVRLLSTINSLDTPVCHVETRRWEQSLAELPAGIVVYTVSMDLPYAQARWQAAEGATHLALSAHKHEEFGRDYGVLLKEWRLLQRAVFVIDRDDRLVHVEYVADQMREPDYAAAIARARATAQA